MTLKLCFLTPEQEKQIKEQNIAYSADDRRELGLLVNSIYDLIQLLMNNALDDQADEPDSVTLFMTLGHLMKPVQEYFANTAGQKFIDSPEDPEEKESA